MIYQGIFGQRGFEARRQDQLEDLVIVAGRGAKCDSEMAFVVVDHLLLVFAARLVREARLPSVRIVCVDGGAGRCRGPRWQRRRKPRAARGRGSACGSAASSLAPAIREQRTWCP